MGLTPPDHAVKPLPHSAAPLRASLLVYFGLFGLALNGAMVLANSKYWNVDFNSLYVAGKLVGSGHLYDSARVEALQLQLGAKALPFMRLPILALAVKPLSALPYTTARILWLGAGLAALAGFVFLWPLSRPAWTAVAVCWSAPAAMCLALGQDSMWFLLFAALGLRLLLQGRDLCAGLALSLCINKPHLALLLPVLLVARGRWRALFGGLTGGIASLGLSFAAEGAGWPKRLAALWPAETPESMPNLRGLLTVFHAGLPVEIALALPVVVAVWFLSRRLPLPTAVALALAGGLLISHHAYFYDGVVLLPALLFPFETPIPEWLRKWALVLLTPIPYLFLLLPFDWPAQLAISGYGLALLAMMACSPRVGAAAS